MPGFIFLKKCTEFTHYFLFLGPSFFPFFNSGIEGTVTLQHFRISPLYKVLRVFLGPRVGRAQEGGMENLKVKEDEDTGGKEFWRGVGGSREARLWRAGGRPFLSPSLPGLACLQS